MEITNLTYIIVPIAFFLISILAISLIFLKRIGSGQAIIKTGLFIKESKVRFGSAVIFPLIEKGELMDLTEKRFEVVREKVDSPPCKDGIRIDILAEVAVRVNKDDHNDIRIVADSLGTEVIKDEASIAKIFRPIIIDAIDSAAASMNYEDIISKIDFKGKIFENLYSISNNKSNGTLPIIKGFVIENISFVHLNQIPIDNLDPDDTSDAKGRRKIRDLTTPEKILENKKQNESRKAIKEDNEMTNQEIRNLDIDTLNNKKKFNDEAREINFQEQIAEMTINNNLETKKEELRVQKETLVENKIMN